MEIEKATKYIVRTLGIDVLCNKDALCNCLEDVLPDVPEHYKTIRMVYDDKVGKILYSAIKTKTGDMDSYKKEIIDSLSKRGMSAEYSNRFIGYFNWIFERRAQKVVKQNTNVQKQHVVAELQKKASNVDDALKKVKIGYCVEFGKYPYWQQGREEPLVWRVLDIQWDKALLVANKVVEYMPASDILNCSSWKDSFLAKWLNSVFYVKAFSNMEMSRLVINKSVNQFITIPSLEELKLYYSDNPKSHMPNFSDGKAKALQTPYVADKNKGSENRYIEWWLRDFVTGNGRVKYVSQYGKIVEPSFDGEAMKAKGVRPLIWVKI